MNEQEFNEMLKRNICITCEGHGFMTNDKYSIPLSIGNTCKKCFGSGKRFQHLLKEGILEI